MVCLPVSQNCKLSLGNRSSLTFNGDFNTTINKVALARMYEDLIPRETKKGKIQIITVYGKAQAMMTNVYSSVSHESYFDKVNSMVKKRFGEAAELKSGYISQKWTRATWYIGEFKSEKDSTQIVKLGITAMDSQTGYSGAVLQPCIFSGKTSHEMFFDETWYAKHIVSSSLYNRVVVIRAPLQGLCYTVRDAVDWCRPPTTRWFTKGSNHSPLHFC